MLDRMIKFGELKITTLYTSQDHSDVHYLWKMRKALSILCVEDSIKVSEVEIVDLHTSMVRNMINIGKGHWYDEWEPGLDSTLPDDLKLASDGYNPPEGSGLFDLTEKDIEERQLYMDYGAIKCWTISTKRENVPAGHFFDSKNKKYPYKNSNGTINCEGILAAKRMAAGVKNSEKASAVIRVKINRMWSGKCKEKEDKK